MKKEEKISFNPVDQVIDDIKLIGENEEQEIAEVQEKDDDFVIGKSSKKKSAKRQKTS